MPARRTPAAGKPHSGKHVAYYRVSTARQGLSGLGLEAQKAAVLAHLNGGSWQLAGEYTEVESGKHTANRPALAAALRDCQLLGARLIVAKLDRLSRNAAFLLQLQDSDVDFVCADMPSANRLTVSLLACVAEHEREMISQRTKDALAAAKARGVRLGGIRPNHRPVDGALGHAAQTHDANAFADRVAPTIAELRAAGMSLRHIADTLNARGVQTPRGGIWHPCSVRNAMLRQAGAPARRRPSRSTVRAEAAPAPAPAAPTLPWHAYRTPGAPRG
jgi:DNA invertase Pin-like site-specific DNA recombinase